MGSTYYFVFRQRSGRIFVTSLHFTSLEPRPSVPDFVLSFGKKSEGEPGRISHVIRWHRDVAIYQT